MNKKNLIFLTVLFLLCAALFSFTAIVSAETLTIEGSGTLNDPYKIYNADGLIAFAGKSNFASAYAELAEDIDLSGSGFNGLAVFGGSFEGKGHTISNLSVSGTSRNMGFFSEISSSGVVTNLKIIASFTASSPNRSLGILAGALSGNISGIHTYGSVNGAAATGGIVGQMASGSIVGCSNSADVNGGTAGGIVGEWTGGSVTHSYSIGSVTAQIAGGGIVGDISRGCLLEYSFNRSIIQKLDPLCENCYIGHIAGISMVEDFENLFYFEIEGNQATNIIGAYGNDFYTDDLPDSATLISDIEAQSSFISLLNDDNPLWAYGALVENGYPTLKTKYTYAAITKQIAAYIYSKGIQQNILLSSPIVEDFCVYYKGATFSSVQYALSAEAPIDAGNYTVYAKPCSDSVIGVLIAEYTIEKADLTADYLLSDKFNSTYTGYTQTLKILDDEGNIPDWNALGLDEPSYEYFRIEGDIKIPVSNIEAKDAGLYEVVATIEGGNNYNNLTGEDALVAMLEITKATLYMKVDDKYQMYGEDTPSFTVSITGFVADEFPAIIKDFVAPTAKYADTVIPVNAGDYLNSIVLVNPNPAHAHNYNFVPLPNDDPLSTAPEGSGSLFIEKANLLNISLTPQSFVYDALPHSLSVTGDILQNTEVLYAENNAPSNWMNKVERTNAGTYRILARIDAGDNYNVLFLSADLTIQKANIVGLIFDDLTVVYDGAPKSPSLETDFDYTIVYVKEGVSSSDAPISAGNYTVFADVEGGNNYIDIRLQASLTIEKRYVRVKANNITTIYGEPLSDTFTVSYFDKLGAKITVPSSLGASAECTPSTPSGEYPILVSVEDTDNFDVVINNGIYTVQKAELRVRVERLKVPYNTDFPAFNLIYTGFVLEEDPSVLLSAPVVTTNAKRGNDVGEYYVTLQGGEAQNYYFILDSGYYLIIEKTERTGITFNSLTKVYDTVPKQIIPNTEEEYSVTYNGDCELPVNAGVYSALLTIQETKNYYSYTATANLTITQAKVSISSNSPSIVYGNKYSNIILNYIFENTETSPLLISLLNANYTCEVNSQNASALDANSYPINIACSPNTNFDIQIVNGSYTINKALLTFSVISSSYKYNEIIAEPEVSVTGFMGEDSFDSLTVVPSLSAIPAKGDVVGTYPIFLSGGEAANYNFKYIHGNIVINKASFADIYTLKDKSVVYDGTIKTVALEWADGRADEVTFLPSLIVSGGTVNKVDAGIYPVSISLEDTAGNYEYISFNAKLTIRARVLEIKGTSAIDRIYNGSTKVVLSGGVLYDGENQFSEPGIFLQLGEGLMADKLAGLLKAVTTNATLTGSGAQNYAVMQPEIFVNILPKSLTILGVSAVNRYYNGDTRVDLIIPDNTIIGIMEKDEVLPDKDGSFGIIDKNAGQLKSVSANIRLMGRDCQNYQLIQPEYITVDVIAGSLFDLDKVYQNDSWQNIAAESFNGEYDKESKIITYSSPQAIYEGSAFVLPLFSEISVEGVEWHIDNATATLAGVYSAVIHITCLNGNFLQETITVTWEIAKRKINLETLTANNKVYDGENTASLLTYVWDILPEDEVTLITESALFEKSTAGSHNVTFAFSLSGKDADNYYLEQEEYTSTSKAHITPRCITIKDVVALPKDYDNSTAIQLKGGELENVINDELTFTLGEGIAHSAAAGEVTVLTNIQILGAAKANYSFTQPELSVIINPKSITIKADSHTIYARKTLPELTYSVEGLIGEDTLEGALSANTNGRKTGKYNISLGTLCAGDNYSIIYEEGFLTVKTPVYVWVIVGLGSALFVAGSVLGITIFIKKRKKSPSIEESREIKD